MTEELRRRIVANAPKEWGWVMWDLGGKIVHVERRGAVPDEVVAMRLLEDMRGRFRDIVWSVSQGRWLVRHGYPDENKFYGCSKDFVTAVAEAWLYLWEKKCPHCGTPIEPGTFQPD